MLERLDDGIVCGQAVFIYARRRRDAVQRTAAKMTAIGERGWRLRRVRRDLND